MKSAKHVSLSAFGILAACYTVPTISQSTVLGDDARRFSDEATGGENGSVY